VQGRIDVLKLNPFPLLIPLLESSDPKAQVSSTITLCHLAQESEGQALMGKYSKQIMARLVDLLSSADTNVVKVAIYTISVACQSGNLTLKQ
jgi:hypothetical protein